MTEKHNKSLPKWASIVFLLLFALPAALALLIPVVGQRDESVLENRSLKKLPAFSLAAFADGSFQDGLEDGLIDQLPLMEPIKEAALDCKNGLLEAQKRLLYVFAPGAKQSYSVVADGYYHFAGDERYIVERPADYSGRLPYLGALAENFSGIPNVKKYVYFIENSRTVDFENPSDTNDIYVRVTEALKPDAAAIFSVPDYDSYKEYFYQTDHHWNYKGSYKGYREIYRLLHGTEEGVFEPVSTTQTDAVFQGSYARQAHVLSADERFTFQSFDLPKYSTEINGRRRNYGNLSAYEKGKYQNEELTNHYANCFGGDFAQIQYDFDAEGKGRLLLVASSYSNPINALIAAGYDRTYVIDLRYYEDWAGAPFDAATFCAENIIDTILLLGDVNFFLGDEADAE